MTRQRRSRAAGYALAVVLALVCTSAPAHADLPSGTDVDYQLGGNRPVPENVGIVVRDRKTEPEAGRYNVCYVNGFQTQPDERAFWRQHWDLVLKRNGKPVEDEAWGEWLLDITTSAKRREIRAIVSRWMRGCVRSGFDAAEFDNLDSFTRSHGLIKRRHALRYAEMLATSAHDAGLEAGQKNLAQFDGSTIGFDFAVAEECGRYRECASYVEHYGNQVIAIEYRRRDFRWTCSQVGDRLPVVLRDRDVSPTGVRRWC